jgi:cysteine sulfinate desulfinase/cysteine desulfurase-like protein
MTLDLLHQLQQQTAELQNGGNIRHGTLRPPPTPPAQIKKQQARQQQGQQKKQIEGGKCEGHRLAQSREVTLLYAKLLPARDKTRKPLIFNILIRNAISNKTTMHYERAHIWCGATSACMMVRKIQPKHSETPTDSNALSES